MRLVIQCRGEQIDGHRYVVVAPTHVQTVSELIEHIIAAVGLIPWKTPAHGAVGLSSKHMQELLPLTQLRSRPFRWKSMVLRRPSASSFA